jgi:tripartite-type tricarboxylate transporter receptor subunit TctC
MLPDVPTLAEAGVEGVEMTTWYGLFITANTPKDIVARLYAETMKILARPEIRKKLEDLGGEPGALTSEQFTAMNRADFERFGKLVKAAGVKGDQ